MTVKSKCVHCGSEVGEWTQDCPKCGKPVANMDAPSVSDFRSKMSKTTNHGKKSPLPLILGVAAVVIIAAVVYFVKYN